MSRSQFILDFLQGFAESKGITRDQMISVEIRVDGITYKFIDLENKTINTIEELRSNRV